MIMVNHSLMTLMRSGISCVCVPMKKGGDVANFVWRCDEFVGRTDITLVRHVNVIFACLLLINANRLILGP